MDTSIKNLIVLSWNPDSVGCFPGTQHPWPETKELFLMKEIPLSFFGGVLIATRNPVTFAGFVDA